jgi:hypothetical protein
MQLNRHELTRMFHAKEWPVEYTVSGATRKDSFPGQGNKEVAMLVKSYPVFLCAPCVKGFELFDFPFPAPLSLPK